jgi:hypothetical protein
MCRRIIGIKTKQTTEMYRKLQYGKQYNLQYRYYFGYVHRLSDTSLRKSSMCKIIFCHLSSTVMNISTTLEVIPHKTLFWWSTQEERNAGPLGRRGAYRSPLWKYEGDTWRTCERNIKERLCVVQGRIQMAFDMVQRPRPMITLMQLRVPWKTVVPSPVDLQSSSKKRRWVPWSYLFTLVSTSSGKIMILHFVK